jgi:hypothetical protein
MPSSLEKSAQGMRFHVFITLPPMSLFRSCGFMPVSSKTVREYDFTFLSCRQIFEKVAGYRLSVALTLFPRPTLQDVWRSNTFQVARRAFLVQIMPAAARL